MKINELFIGAWVLNGGIPAQVTGITCDGILETTAYRCTNIEQVGPILLTPEILEDNGFNKISQKDCVEPFYWQMKRYDEDENMLFCITAFRNFFYGMKVYLDNQSDCVTIHLTKQIENVHELQKAIGIAGIDMEITVHL